MSNAKNFTNKLLDFIEAAQPFIIAFVVLWVIWAWEDSPGDDESCSTQQSTLWAEQPR